MNIESVNTHYFIFESLDNNFSNGERIYTIESGSMDETYDDELGPSATLSAVIALNEEFETKKIRIYSVLNEEKSLLRTFLVSTSHENIEDDHKSIDITCYSTLCPLSTDKIERRLFIPLGTNAVAEVKRILVNYEMPVFIEDCRKATTEDKDYEIGTSYITIINDLLKSVGYTLLHVDEYGNYRAEQECLPEDRTPTRFFDTTDEQSVVEIDISSSIDMFNVHNVFVCYTNSADIDYSATYENSNPDSPTSTANAYRNILPESVTVSIDESEGNLEARYYDALYSQCKKNAANEIKGYRNIEFKTPIYTPIFQECIQLDHPAVLANVIESGYHIDLETGGSMTHTTYQVIPI